MTGKLVKFEFRSSFRMLAVIWAALLAMSILMCVVVSVTGLTSYGDFVQSKEALAVISGIITFISWVVYVALFASLVILTIALVIARFYKGLLDDEGYLMHTLPVKPWQLITAKGITAACAVIGSMLVAFISILLIACAGNALRIGEFFGEIAAGAVREPILILLVFEMIILGVLGILKSIYQIYAAISIGQLANRHRLLASLGAYIGICFVLSVLAGIFVFIDSLTGLGSRFVTWIGSYQAIITAEGLTGFGPSQVVMLILFLATAVQLVAFHAVSEQLLTKKLNLL